MATSPMPNPQGSAPPPDPSQGQSANPLQTGLAQVAMVLRQLGQQNQIIADDMQTAFQAVVQALQKVSQAASGPPTQTPAPPQGA